MANVLIYTTPVCPFCVRAKELLSSKGVTEFEEIDVSVNATIRDEMIKRSGGRRTVPQIFISEHHVGGFDDLAAINQTGELDSLLGNE